MPATRNGTPDDPHHFSATHPRQDSEEWTRKAIPFGAIYLLLHGALKAVLVAALLPNKLWAYPRMTGTLIVFIACQIYRIAVTPDIALTPLTAFDALLIVLTWHEYRSQRVRHST